jgi:hypothetical protein
MTDEEALEHASSDFFSFPLLIINSPLLHTPLPPTTCAMALTKHNITYPREVLDPKLGALFLTHQMAGLGVKVLRPIAFFNISGKG